MSEEDLRRRFARLQAGSPAAAATPPELARARLPAASQPTLDDLVQLFLALDGERAPRALGALLWLIHGDRQTAGLLRRLQTLALDAADPEDGQAAGHAGWTLGALATARALDHLLAAIEWDDPGAELDPAGRQDDDLVPVLRACEARLRRGEGDPARLFVVRQRLRAYLAQRRLARVRAAARRNPTTERLDELERALTALAIPVANLTGAEPGNRPSQPRARFSSTDRETVAKPDRSQAESPAKATQQSRDGETAIKPERSQDA